MVIISSRSWGSKCKFASFYVSPGLTNSQQNKSATLLIEVGHFFLERSNYTVV